MVARLVPAELRLHVSDSEIERYAQGEGWLEVFANRARVLIAEAMPPDELDASRAQAAPRGRRAAASTEAEEGSAAAEQAERERARCEAFLADRRRRLSRLALRGSVPGARGVR